MASLGLRGWPGCGCRCHRLSYVTGPAGRLWERPCRAAAVRRACRGVGVSDRTCPRWGERRVVCVRCPRAVTEFGEPVSSLRVCKSKRRCLPFSFRDVSLGKVPGGLAEPRRCTQRSGARPAGSLPPSCIWGGQSRGSGELHSLPSVRQQGIAFCSPLGEKRQDSSTVLAWQW